MLIFERDCGKSLEMVVGSLRMLGKRNSSGGILCSKLPLQNLFPDLFSISVNKRTTVADYMDDQGDVALESKIRRLVNVINRSY